MWLLRNPLLSGVGILALLSVTLLSVQTARLGWVQNKNESLNIRLKQYEGALILERETSRRREAVITTDITAEKVRSRDLARKIEEIENDQDEPIASVILNAIGRL